MPSATTITPENAANQRPVYQKFNRGHFPKLRNVKITTKPTNHDVVLASLIIHHRKRNSFTGTGSNGNPLFALQY